MKLLQNILTTVDMGKSTNFVIESSVQLAKKFNSQITLMHVITEENISEQLKTMVKDSIKTKLDKIAQKMKSEGITINNIIIEYGVAFEKIIQEAQNNNYNVIVAGSGNKTANDSFKLGTTVEKLVRKNQIPLFVVKNESVRDIHQIICPVDFSEASARALHNAIILAEKYDAELTILNVFSPINIYSKRFDVDSHTENTNLKAKQEKDFHSFLEQFNLVNVNHRIEIIEGEPFAEILQYIKKNNIDLLLMGTTGKTLLSRLLMGSVTEKVIRELPCSFITTKAKDITDGYFESNLISIESILNSAKLSYQEKDYEKALEKYSIALKQYPDSIPIILGLIETNQAIGNEGNVAQYKEYAKEVVRRIWGKEYLDKLGF